MTRHAIIIGGGVIGLSSAYHCLQRGLRVTIIDRHPPTRTGCSFGNAGMIVPSHFVPLAAPGMVMLGLKWMWNPRSPFYIKPRLSWDLLTWAFRFWRSCTKEHVARSAPLLRDLHLASRACYEELAAQWNDAFELKRHGLLMLCKTRHALDEESRTAEKAIALGIPAEVHDAASTAKLDPDVKMDVQGSVFFPRDCHLSPDKLMAQLQSRLKQGGATFIWNAPVTGFDHDGGRVRCVKTTQGHFEADEFILAGGAWTTDIGSMLSLSLPMQAGKGYSVTLENPRELPRICSILTEARVAVTPMGGSLRFGGTMEIAGLNEKISPQRVQGIIEAAPRYFPNFQVSDFAGIEPWRGLRPCSPDGLPYMGRPRRYGNVIVATGHAMMGLSLAPISGKLVSQIATGDKPEIDLSLLSPDRF